MLGGFFMPMIILIRKVFASMSQPRLHLPVSTYNFPTRAIIFSTILNVAGQ